jgi:hypothetical protein
VKNIQKLTKIIASDRIIKQESPKTIAGITSNYIMFD